MVFEVGRVCLKTAGRDAGGICTIVNKVDAHNVLVTGPKLLTGVRRRKVNIDHLHPTQEKVKVKADATDVDVLDAYKKEDLFSKFRLEPITEDDLKKYEAQKAEREIHKKEIQKKQEVAKAEKKLVAKKGKVADKKEEHKAEHKPEHPTETKPEAKPVAEKKPKAAAPKENV